MAETAAEEGTITLKVKDAAGEEMTFSTFYCCYLFCLSLFCFTLISCSIFYLTEVKKTTKMVNSTYFIN